MLSVGVMVTTTMVTACVLSFLEVDVEVVVVEVDQWAPRGEGMVPPPDARNTGCLCQVGDVFLTLQVLLISFI